MFKIYQRKEINFFEDNLPSENNILIKLLNKITKVSHGQIYAKYFG